MAIPIALDSGKGFIDCDNSLYELEAFDYMYGGIKNSVGGWLGDVSESTTCIKLYKHGITNTSDAALQKLDGNKVTYSVSNIIQADNFDIDCMSEGKSSPYDVFSEYVNWIFGASVAISFNQYLTWEKTEDKDYTGPGGVCAYGTINNANAKNLIYDPDIIGTNNTLVPGTYLCNICRRNVTPYGGTTDTQLSLITWRSYGDYFNIE